MNQNDLFLLLVAGQAIVAVLYVLYYQWKRIKYLEDSLHEVFRDMLILTAAKKGDHPTARIMASVAKSNLSAGALKEVIVPEEKKPNTFSILQSAG